MIAAIVLAAGGGRRFGGAKQVALLGGRPLLAHVLDAARALPRVIVVLGGHAETVRAAVDLSGVEAVECPDWREGQSASLRCGVAAAGDIDAAVVLLADMPYVTHAVVAGIASAYDPERCDAVRATYGGVAGHPVLLGRPVLERVPELRGDTGARQLLPAFRVGRWEAGSLADPRDIDTPEHLEVTAP